MANIRPRFKKPLFQLVRVSNSFCFTFIGVYKTFFRPNESPKVAQYWPSPLQGRSFLVRKLLCFVFFLGRELIILSHVSPRQLSKLQFAASNSCIWAAKLQDDFDLCKCNFHSQFFWIFLINFGFKRNDYRLLISDASELHHNDFSAYQETTAAYKPTETTTRSYEALLEAAYRARFSKCCHDYDLKDCIPGQCGILKQICCF